MRKFVYLSVLLIAISPFVAPKAVLSIKTYLKERYPGEFRVDKIALNLKGDFPTFDMPDLHAMIQGPFRYLGEGGQAIAFESEDHEYVLKFFLVKSLHGAKKHLNFKPTHWIPSHRKTKKEQREQKAQARLVCTLHNYAKAFSILKEQTGILALQLRPKERDLPIVTLYDALGKEHTVDLSQASFVLQKKVTIAEDKIREPLSLEKKIALIQSLENWIIERTRLGLVDFDPRPSIGNNYGFMKDLPMQLDLGKLVFREEAKENPDMEIQKMRRVIKDWAMSQGLPEKAI